MARKVFISFLGLGNPTKENPYEPVKYFYLEKYNVTKDDTTFVQCAELELYPNISSFDKYILLSTVSSYRNITKLKEEIASKGIVIDEKKFDTTINDISDELTNPDAAWEWFGKLQAKIESGDEIVWDVTHGFRIIPIVFSAAIGYLKRAKNITLTSVLYGAYVPPKPDEKKESYPIVDVKDFYTITDWAEGVGRLVDDADAGFLLNIAEKENAGGFVGLNNKDLLENIAKLTRSVRNVELQNIESNAKIALEAIQKSINSAQSLEKQILEMIVYKFTPLISEVPINGQYSKEYLSLQLKLIELLATHGLYMQCFTAMREWLGSLGLAILGVFSYNKAKKAGNSDERARSYSEIFVRMLQYRPNKWIFTDEKQQKRDELLPAYNALKNCLTNFDDTIIKLFVDMNDVRNGFDHGWTGKHISGVPNKIHEVFINARTIFQSIIDNWDEIVKPNNILLNSQLSTLNSQLFINLSNHSSSNWPPQQLAAARTFGEVVDLPFPDVNPNGDDEYIQSLVNEYMDTIMNNFQFSTLNSQLFVHIMGEMTFTFAMVSALQKQGITCVASTTERVSSEGNGMKTSEFRFVQFRKYQ